MSSSKSSNLPPALPAGLAAAARCPPPPQREHQQRADVQALGGEVAIGAEEVQHDRQHQHHGEVGGEEKDDAFSAALVDLEQFQVDYLEKNLRLKPRKGKQFNFTDPEGSADRLFVFHRDVERARERLKRGDSPAN